MTGISATLTCAHCGQPLGHYRSKYCSKTCSDKARNARERKNYMLNADMYTARQRQHREMQRNGLYVSEYKSECDRCKCLELCRRNVVVGMGDGTVPYVLPCQALSWGMVKEIDPQEWFHNQEVRTWQDFLQPSALLD